MLMGAIGGSSTTMRTESIAVQIVAGGSSPGGADIIYVKTSGGVILETPAPPRSGPPVSTVYWKTKF